MLKLEIEIEDLDYLALSDKLIPIASDALKDKDEVISKLVGGKITETTIFMLLSVLSQDKKDGYAAMLINDSKEVIKKALEKKIEETGIEVNIKDINAVSDWLEKKEFIYG